MSQGQAERGDQGVRSRAGKVCEAGLNRSQRQRSQAHEMKGQETGSERADGAAGRPDRGLVAGNR